MYIFYSSSPNSLALRHLRQVAFSYARCKTAISLITRSLISGIILASYLNNAQAAEDNHSRTLRIALGDPPKSLDVLRVNIEASFSTLRHLFLPMINESGLKQWQLLEDWQVSDNQLEYTLKLRAGLFWSDGTPLTVDDFITALEYQADHAEDNFVQHTYVSLKQKDGRYQVEKIDKQTIKLFLKQPDPFFIDGLSTLNSNVLSAQQVLRHGDDWHLPEHIHTLSPYRLETIDLPKKIILKKIADFPGAEELAWERLEIHFIPALEQRLQAFRQGDFDLIQITALSHAMVIPENLFGELILQNVPNTRFLSLNPGRDIMHDPRLREAIMLLIDPDTLIYHHNSPMEKPLYSLIPPDIDRHYQPVTRPEYSLKREERFARARSLLEAMDITPQQPLQIDFKVLDKRATRLPAQRLQNLFARYGLELKPSYHETSEHYGNYFKGDYDMIALEWFHLSGSPIHYQLLPYGPNSPLVNHGYKNQAVMEDIRKTRTALNKTQAYAALKRVETGLLEDHYTLPYAVFYRGYLIGPHIDQEQAFQDPFWLMKPAQAMSQPTE